MVNKLYTSEFNVKLRTTLKRADISGYTAVNYQVKKPSGAELTLPLTVEDDGAISGDAVVFYYTQAGDLDEIGNYAIQVIAEFENARFLSDTVYFPVFNSYK
ncbi:MAG: hypothetical protein ACFFDT_00255 [Candidatus Hodarchaeota archaeon]